MKSILRNSIMTGLCAMCVHGMAFAAVVAPDALTVEYRTEPVGLDAAAPRLAWQMRAPEKAKDVSQSAWRVQVALSRKALEAGRPDLWDSGRVAGDATKTVYAGKPLASCRKIWWRVKTWDNAGAESAWSAPATWQTAIMRPEDWSAKWIGPAACTRPDEDFAGAEWITAAPDAKGVTVLSNTFVFASVPGADACVEFDAAGVSQYEITVNGRAFNKFSGAVHDWRYPRYRNLAPWLKADTNVVVVKVFADDAMVPGEPTDHIRYRAAKGTRAFIGCIRLPGGRTIRTDARSGWTSPAGTVQALGSVRATDFGKAMILRREIATPCFAKSFTLAKPVVRAVLNVTGLGYYEASLDGAKIGAKVLDPSPTAYDKHVLYSTYDLSSKLTAGAHELKILLGHGWYDMRSVATWNFDTSPWRDFPRALAQLDVVYEDGTTERIVTDRTWREVKSDLGYDDLFEGEVTGAADPRAAALPWATMMADEVPAPKGRLVASQHPGAQVMRTFPAKSVKAFPGGVYVIDAGENVSGWVRFTLRGQKKGDVISVRYDERVNDDGSPALESTRDGLHDRASVVLADGTQTRCIDHHFRYTGSHRVCSQDASFQTDRIVCTGSAPIPYQPHFQFSGFRYVVVRGLAAAPRAADVTVCVVRTAFAETGIFECSDATFNTLMRMTAAAYRSNFTDGYPTDCPHREKNGWTGDAAIASELAQYMVENTAAYEKWLRDICDSQLDDGNLSCIIPSSGWGYHWGNGPGWDSALPMIAWNLWLYRGDRRILDAIWGPLEKYLAYTARKADAQGLVSHGLGDWIPVVREHMPTVAYTTSCYYLQAQEIAAKIAALKGLPDAAARYAAGAVKTRAGIHAKYHKGDGVYDNGGQTAQACALAFGVVPADLVPAARRHLVESCEKTGAHVDMGLYGTKHVFRALSLAGRTDLAFRMLTNPTWPSPVCWLQQGGTTLWEDWTVGGSRNHIMFGDFAAWAYQFLAGIRLPEGGTQAVPDPAAVGFRKVLIAPQPIASLSYVRASVAAPEGKIAVQWKQDDWSLSLTVDIPPNVTAEVRLPYNGGTRMVGSGHHTFLVSRLERQFLWPAGKMPDAQPHQIGAMTDAAGTTDFKRDENRAPYIDWLPPPAKPNGACMILVSGGSYQCCCDVGLVKFWGRRFTELGYQCVNLCYRTPRPQNLPIHQTAWEDGQRAVRLVRSQAAKRGFNPEKIGAIGMSAGGHLVCMLATSALTRSYPKIDALDDVPCHVNVTIANAPAYNTATAARGDARPQDGTTLTNLTVNPSFAFDAKTCPMSFHHGAHDPYTPNGSTLCYRELRKRHVPAELHLYADRGHGAHGFERALEFLNQIEFVEKLPRTRALDHRFMPGDTLRTEKEMLWPEGKIPDVATNQTYKPYLVWFVPEKLTTKAIQVIVPGGGYNFCNFNGEGTPAAHYLNGKGMTAVVVMYRCPRVPGRPKYATAWEDAQRAIRLVRAEAPARGLDPNRIGLMGYSAGGHLTLMTATNGKTPAYAPVDDIDKQPCTLAWAVPVYPAYALTDGVNGGNTTGGNDDSAVIVPEFSFDSVTPPMCFFHGDADGISAMNSVKCWERLRAMGVQCDLHTLAKRGHCFQMDCAPGTGSWTWMDQLWDFLVRKGFAK